MTSHKGGARKRIQLLPLDPKGEGEREGGGGGGHLAESRKYCSILLPELFSTLVGTLGSKGGYPSDNSQYLLT